jgi:hypothetical protein
MLGMLSRTIAVRFARVLAVAVLALAMGASSGACGIEGTPPVPDTDTPTTRLAPGIGGTSFPERAAWKPGERLNVGWEWGEERPSSAVLGLKLMGLYASADGLQPGESEQPALATASALVERPETGRTYAVALELPEDLEPGYYGAVATMGTPEGATTATATRVIRVVSR